MTRLDIEIAREMQGYDVAQHVLRQRFSRELLERNYAELDSFLSYLESPFVSAQIGQVEQRWRRHEAMVEVVALLHNYVGSAKALVDHTRRIYKKIYKPRGLIGEYQARVDAVFKDDPLAQFVEDFRDMSHHYRLPSISFVGIINYASGRGLTTHLRLHRDDLLAYDNWTGPARAYLDQAGEHIDVRDLTREYHKRVTDFHQWFASEQERLHGGAPEQLARVIKHGRGEDEAAVITKLTGGVARLEAVPNDRLTLSDVHDALLPGLTVQDSRHLIFFEYDSRVWLDHAVLSIEKRFPLPADLRRRLLALTDR